MTPADPETPERRLHQVLRRLPDRPAPRTLERRVAAELARRAALPWWRRSYVAWPTWLRGTFLALAALAAAALVAGPDRAFTELARHIEWLAVLRSVGGSIASSVRDVANAIPAPWLYGALAIIAALYAALAGIGMATYRLFFRTKTSLPRILLS
jgi:hypothetical protein